MEAGCYFIAPRLKRPEVADGVPIDEHRVPPNEILNHGTSRNRDLPSWYLRVHTCILTCKRRMTLLQRCRIPIERQMVSGSGKPTNPVALPGNYTSGDDSLPSVCGGDPSPDITGERLATRRLGILHGLGTYEGALCW